MSPRLPHHRRISWGIWLKNSKRPLVLCEIAFLTGILVIIGILFAIKHVEISDYRMRLTQLQHDVISSRTFGQFTVTDYQEQTTELNVRPIQ